MKTVVGGNTSRRARKKEETRLKIIDVAMGLFRKQGFDATTVDQIAEKADLAKGTLYNYFPVKESILHGYMQSSAQDSSARVHALVQALPDTRTRLTAFFGQLSEWMKSNQDIFRIYMNYRVKNLLHQTGDKSQRSGFADNLKIIIRAGQEAGEIRKDLSAEILSLHLEMMNFGVVICWLAGVEKFSLQKAYQEAISLFLEGAKQGVKPKG